MRLSGRKLEVLVTIDTNTYQITIDSVSKVVTIQGNASTTLADIKQVIFDALAVDGFKPSKVIHKKVKAFRF